MLLCDVVLDYDIFVSLGQWRIKNKLQTTKMLLQLVFKDHNKDHSKNHT